MRAGHAACSGAKQVRSPLEYGDQARKSRRRGGRRGRGRRNSRQAARLRGVKMRNPRARPVARLRRLSQRRAHKPAHACNQAPSHPRQAQVFKRRKAVAARPFSQRRVRGLRNGDIRRDGVEVHAAGFQAAHSLSEYKGFRPRRLAHNLRRARALLRTGGVRGRRVGRPARQSVRPAKGTSPCRHSSTTGRTGRFSYRR